MPDRLVFTMNGRIVLNGKEVGRYKRLYSRERPGGGMRLTDIVLRIFGDEGTQKANTMKQAREIVIDRMRTVGLARREAAFEVPAEPAIA